MTLSKKLATINNPNIPGVVSGYSETIKDFWDDFIQPLLPDKKVVINFYEMLLKYVNEPDAVYALRAFFNWKDNKVRDSKDLRRGFLNDTDLGYSFFYTDNYFAAYFFKMAKDGYVPDYEEFKMAMQTREFPARYGRHDKQYELKKAAYSINGAKGKNPQIGNSGYKIAHIINVGEDYRINGITRSLTEICNLYYPRGEYDDWKLESCKFGDVYIRHLQGLNSEARDLLVAHFLRFVCPLNYILTPKTSCHTTKVKVFRNDIAESKELQQYAMEKFKELYGAVYDEFLKKALFDTSKKMTKDPGNYYVGIEYGYGINNNSSKTSPTLPSGSSSRDNTKYDFNGLKKLSKGKTVYEVVKKYVEDNPTVTEDELRNAFPDSIRSSDHTLRSGGVIKNYNDENIDISRFSKPPISLSDSTQIGVSNQFTLETMNKFIEKAKDAGYTIIVST